MTKAQIIELQKRVGTTADGFWGPVSTAKCQKYLRKRMPSPNPWPTQATVRSGDSIFGKAGKPPMVSFSVPYTMWLYGDKTQPVTKISCHKLVAPSLQRILTRLSEMATLEEISEFGMDRYYGCFNNRTVRGGNSISMHAFAIAIDFDATRNGNASHWPLRSHMPIEVMELFAEEGWLSAGAFWSRDAMHFQATQ